MKDLKAPLLVAVPAAITILGIIWFLRKMSGDDKDGKKGKRSQKASPPEKISMEKEGTERPTSPNNMKIEGITLTQRKIPETGDKNAGQTATFRNHDSLTECEREKVREIVDAAIGAGLKEARGEVLKATSVAEKPVEVHEEMIVESVESVQCSMNNNTQEVQSYDKIPIGKEVGNKSLNHGNYIDNRAISEFFTSDHQTTLDKGESSPVSSNVPKHHSSSPESFLSSSANVVSASPSPPFPMSSSSHGDNDNISQSSSNTVPSKSISTKQADDKIISSPLPADLSVPSIPSPSSLPSTQSTDISSNDSVLDDSSSLVSDIKPQNILVSSHDNLSSSSSEPSESTPSTSVLVDASQLGHDMSREQVVGKTEESSSSSHNSTSPVCDNNSVGSSDSGRGGSEHDVICQGTDSLIHFDFNMPSELCGRLIGKKGYNINQLKAKSGANVSLTHNPLSAEFQICQVVGLQAEVDEALRIIRHKFPLEDHPRLTMTPIALNVPKSMEPAPPVIVPDNMQLSLPDGASVEVYVSTIVDAGHVFVQQPTHRTFMSLDKLSYVLNAVYSQDDSIPSLPRPIECGVICVCEIDGSWYRTMVMSPENEFGECQVKFVDYGGYTQLPVSCIKQIRADFMNLPFQAVECIVANIAPLPDQEYFSRESTMALSDMSQMKLLQCQVVARNEIGTPFIHLYMVNPENRMATMVNKALVNNGFVRWVEIV